MFARTKQTATQQRAANNIIMMVFTRTLLSLLVFATLPSRRHTLVHAQGIDDVIRWVVTFNEGVLPDASRPDLLAIAGIDVPEIPLQIPELYMSVFMMSPSIAKKVMNLPVVKYVERDIEVKMIAPVSENTADFSSPARQVGTERTPYGIDMVQALEVPDDNVGAVTVCVIDSGYDIEHADLPGSAVVTGSDVIGVQPWFVDDNSHGTHVTGMSIHIAYYVVTRNMNKTSAILLVVYWSRFFFANLYCTGNTRNHRRTRGQWIRRSRRE